MCDPGTLTIAATLAAVAATATSTIASYQQARYEAKVADVNRKAESARAQDAIERGDVAVRNESRQRSQMAGAQRAALAANGIDLSFGSAADLTADTAMFASEDLSTVRKNSEREAMGYDINAANFGAQASAARGRATGALISGAISTASTLAGGAQRYGKVKALQSAGLSGWGA